MGTLILSRTKQYHPRTGQRIRLTATVTPATASGVHNLTTSFGTYDRIGERAGLLTLAHSDSGKPPYDRETDLFAASLCTGGRIAIHPRTRRIHLLCEDGGRVMERVSDDEGATFGDGALVFASANRPDIVAGRWGTVLRAARVGGKLQFTREDGAGTTAAAFIKDTTGTDLLIQDTSFRFQEDADGRWWLHVRLQGEGATSLWYSTDEGATWARGSGGITGGAHPGVAVGWDATMLGWAHVAGKLHFFRVEGDGVPTTPAAVKDTTGTDLTVQDLYSSFALAWEGPRRWVLATVLTGETLPSDWHLGDDGATAQRFT